MYSATGIVGPSSAAFGTRFSTRWARPACVTTQRRKFCAVAALPARWAAVAARISVRVVSSMILDRDSAVIGSGPASGAVTATFNEIENADAAIMIGCNPLENHPVAATFFKQFAKRGGNLIVMDPRHTGLSRYATHTLQFKPGAIALDHPTAL